MDLTVAATPFYFGTMGAEHWWLQRQAAERGPTAADYEPHDTRASLTMGVLSLVAPIVAPKVLGPLMPGAGPLCQGAGAHRRRRRRGDDDRRSPGAVEHDDLTRASRASRTPPGGSGGAASVERRAGWPPRAG